MSCVTCQASGATLCAPRCLYRIQMMMQRASSTDYQASFATKAAIFLMVCLSTGYSYVYSICVSTFKFRLSILPVTF